MEVLFPLWQVEPEEYEAVCEYLGLSAKAAIHAKLNTYLAEAPFRFSRPSGFWRFLAEPRLTRFRIARLDLATRMCGRSNPIRHLLNATIALHECDPDGYAQMAAPPTGRTRVITWLAAGVAMFALNLLLTLGWLAIQVLRYASRLRRDDAADLAGKRVLVTGAAHGLGRDVLLECLERGAQVVATVRGQSSLDELHQRLPSEAPVRLLLADLTRPGSLIDALNSAHIDPRSLAIAVLCAGTKHDGNQVLAVSDVRDTFEVNFFSAVEFARWLFGTEPATAPAIALVVVSSMGRWHGMHSTAGYNASKAAVSIWAESLEMDLRRAGAPQHRVCVVEPGLFDSGMTRHSGPMRLLHASRRQVARHIVCGAVSGSRTIRTPFWFALLTWAICLAGRRFRSRLFSRAKDGMRRAP